MSITITTAPSKRASGRRPRLSDEDIKDLKDGMLAAFKAVADGKDISWLTDNEAVDTKSAAYQRAQSARDLVLEVLGDQYTVEHIKTAAEPVDLNDLTKGWLWKIGPRPEGEKPRKKPTKKTSTAKSGASK